MKPISIKSNTPSNFIKISYSPTDKCNYSCRYCFPGCNAGLHSWPTDLNLIVDNFLHLFEYYRSVGKTQIELQILGGEPTLWPDLDKFIYELKKHASFKATIQSNGSRTMRWWEEHGNVFDKVNLSAHHKQIDLAHFTQVADTLYDLKVYVDVSVCMDPYAWDQCVSMIDYFKKNSRNKWYIGTQKIEESNQENLYTDDQLKFLSKSIKRYPSIWYAFSQRSNFNINRSIVTLDDGTKQKVKHNQVQINNWNHFYGWECNIGIDSLYIDLRGSMSGSCNQSLYGLDTKFNIYDADFKEKFHPFLKPVKCKQLGCYCTPETLLTKTLVKGMSAAQVQKLRSQTIESTGTSNVSL
jgi:MoaA/NifB/PqqE/SkfB family radical SAM enzyme